MEQVESSISNTSSPLKLSDIEMSATSSASTIDDSEISKMTSPFRNSLFNQRTTNITRLPIETLTTTTTTTPEASIVPILARSNGVSNGSGWVRLNVGGKIFQTTRSTLMREPGSFLYRLCQDEQGLSSDRDETGAYLIDRDAEFFSPILNYLRHGKLILNPGMSEEGILAEADFYNLPMLSQLIMDRIQERENGLKDVSLVKFVYRVLQCHEEELASVVSAMSDGWKIVQVVPINSNYSAYNSDQQQEYLCIVERECPDNGTMGESQDRAKLLQQRARHN